MRTTVIRAVAASALLSAISLGVGGCVNSEQPANPANYPTTSYGNATVAPTATSTPPATETTTGTTTGTASVTNATGSPTTGSTTTTSKTR